ncbi:MAG: CopG family transcriptional regulator [Deltaproteobacteria bacterium]|nr:CopG family transcriptional regulator [Deltaproteobacteria bacterium]
MYGVHRTTVYLPDDSRRALDRLAAERSCTVAELIREAIRAMTAEAEAPRPTLPLFKSGDETLAERVEEALEGFGES